MAFFFSFHLEINSLFKSHLKSFFFRTLLGKVSDSLTQCFLYNLHLYYSTFQTVWRHLGAWLSPPFVSELLWGCNCVFFIFMYAVDPVSLGFMDQSQSSGVWIPYCPTCANLNKFSFWKCFYLKYNFLLRTVPRFYFLPWMRDSEFFGDGRVGGWGCLNSEETGLEWVRPVCQFAKLDRPLALRQADLTSTQGLIPNI